MSTPPTFDANTADTRRIGRWLGTALDGYFKDDIGRWAFRPLEQHIGLHDDLADDLCAIYDSLAASAQARWRTAICDLLAFHGRDISKRESTRALIAFAVLIRSPEVLDVLPGILSGEDDGELLHLAVGAATALASQTEASLECLERIRTSPAFTSHYAGLILVALCHADPDNWLRHVKALAIPMGELASQLSPESTALRFYASNILDAISLSRVSHASLTALSAPGSDGLRWLLKEWFQEDQSLLRLRPTAFGTRIVLRADDSICTELHHSHDLAAFQAGRLRAFRRTTVAWECAGLNRPRVAVCNDDALTELTSIEASREALVTTISNFLGPHVIGQLESFPMRRGVAIISAGEIPIVRTGNELRVPENRLLRTNYTDRVRYLSKRSQHVSYSLRRFAINDRGAFEAAAMALDAHSTA